MERIKKQQKKPSYKKKELVRDYRQRLCLCVSSLPCSDSVHSSCYSWGQSPYPCHSHMVHMLETPTNPWDTGGLFCTREQDTHQRLHECVESHKENTSAPLRDQDFYLLI